VHGKCQDIVTHYPAANFSRNKRTQRVVGLPRPGLKDKVLRWQKAKEGAANKVAAADAPSAQLQLRQITLLHP